MLTQDKLKELLEYNEETGIFTWVSVSKFKPYILSNFAGTASVQGYIEISINRVKHKAHRLAWLYMTGAWPKQIDHINGIRNDNRWVNLRECSQSQNNKNASLSKRNKYGLKGVTFTQGKFKSTCTVDKKTYHLGYYNTAIEASKVYEMFAKSKFGDFYRS